MSYYDEADADVFCTDNSTLEGAVGGSEINDPRYGDVDARIKSFPEDWNNPPNQSPLAMAKAGFVYQHGDTVRCHQCGLKIWDWKPDDLPWNEHVKHNKSCEYVQQNLSADYIKSIQTTHEDKKCQEALVYLKQMGYEQKQIYAVIHILQEPGGLQSKIDKAIEHMQSGFHRDPSKDKLTCINCKFEKVKILFMPCSHVVSCAGCADTTNKCFTCKRNIAERIVVYCV